MWTVHWDLALTAGRIDRRPRGAGLERNLSHEAAARKTPDEALAPEEQLQRYQQMVEDGLLDPQDFARIQARMQPKPSEPTPPASNQPPDTSIRE